MFPTMLRGVINKVVNPKEFCSAQYIVPFTTRSSNPFPVSTTHKYKPNAATVPYYQQVRGSRFGINSSTQETNISNEQSPEGGLRSLGKLLTKDAAWSIRLACENGYLSWCRNTYLCTAVGVMMTGQTIGNIIGQYAASGAFMISGLNLFIGTINYSYQLIGLRHITQMSLPVSIFYTTLSLLHLCAWSMIIVLFLGNQEDFGDVEIIGVEEFSPESRA